MTSSGRIRLRLWFYGIILGYFICDFVIFHGPLFHAALKIVKPEKNVAALVADHVITLEQVERAALEKLWLESKDPAALPPFERKSARLAALNDLIDREILRELASAHQDEIEVTSAEIDHRLRMLAARFTTRDEMKKSMLAQGIRDEKNLRYREASLIRQEKFIRRETAAQAAVNEEEARAWFSHNAANFRIPARIEIRHIFLPTLNQSESAIKTKIDAALADLVSGKKDFATLAKEISADPASAENGGDLGWITRERIISDFSAAVFLLSEHKPSVVRSRLGWHLVEVTGKKAAEDRTWDEGKTEVIAALEAMKRKQAVEAFRGRLRKEREAQIQVMDQRITDAPFS